MEYALIALALVVAALGLWHLSLVSEPMIDDALAKLITGRGGPSRETRGR